MNAPARKFEFVSPRQELDDWLATPEGDEIARLLMADMEKALEHPPIVPAVLALTDNLCSGIETMIATAQEAHRAMCDGDDKKAMKLMAVIAGYDITIRPEVHAVHTLRRRTRTELNL